MQKKSPKIRWMGLGDPGKNGLNAPSPVVLVEEPKTESGAVTLLLQLMVEKNARGDTLPTGFATRKNVIKRF